LDLRNFPVAVWRFIGEQRDVPIDGGLGGLERALQPQAVEQVPKLWPWSSAWRAIWI
jgi:hypothetical protein